MLRCRDAPLEVAIKYKAAGKMFCMKILENGFVPELVV